MAKRLKKFFPLLVLLLLIFWIFKSWFSWQPIAARDWFFLYPQNLKDRPWFPEIWGHRGWGGMGRVKPYNWSFFYSHGVVKILSSLGLAWPVIEKLIWYWPYFPLAIFSSVFLFKTLFPKNKFWFLAPFLFLLNTFSLIITSGGQMGVALAGALSPLTIALLIRGINLPLTARRRLIIALVFAFQLMLDPRVFYLTLLTSGFYFIFHFLTAAESKTKLLKKYFQTGLFLGGVSLGLNFFWILPVVLIRGPLLPATYGESGWVQFLSFARFSGALSLLHPFWPENIFGKTYFFKPAFLLFPILAFSSLLFLKNLKPKTGKNRTSRLLGNRAILFFSFLAIGGAFLAKGSNPPFGEVYLGFFKNFPGFNMFRDPIKFYLLVAWSYALLIPVGVAGIYQFLGSLSDHFPKKSWPKIVKGKILANVFLLSLAGCFLLILKPVFLSEMKGTLERVKVPKDYQRLADFLSQDNSFGRSLWLPRRQTFGFSSSTHPPVWAEAFISAVRERRPFSSLLVDKYDSLSYLRHPAAREIFKILGLKYAIVPLDFREEIFLKNREYDPQQFQRRITALDQVSWLKKLEATLEIGLYQADFEARRFFPAKSTFFVVGADDFYATVSAWPKVKLSDYSFYFLEQNLGEKPKPQKGDFLVLNQKTKEDLTLSFLNQEETHSFYPFLKEKEFFGWEAIDLVNSTRTVGLGNIGFDFGQNMVLSREGGVFVFPFEVSQEGDYEIWMRVLANHLGGELQLTLNSGRRIKILTQEPEDGFVWKRLGNGFSLSQGGHRLEIKNRRGLNALNLLAVLPKEKLEEYQKKAEEYLQGAEVLSFSGDREAGIPEEILEKSLPQIDSQRLGTSRYLVNVKNAQEPFWLIFSETFHPLWQVHLDQEKIAPIKVFNLINAFYIPQTGDFEFEVEFEAQKHVYWGLLGSGLTALFILYRLAKLIFPSRVILPIVSMFRTARAKFSLLSRS